jgi:TRAP-type C4-dicarboxylate transport system permease large subunit
VIPFIMVILAGLALLTAFPDLALWLPSHMMTK